MSTPASRADALRLVLNMVTSDDVERFNITPYDLLAFAEYVRVGSDVPQIPTRTGTENGEEVEPQPLAAGRRF